MDLKDYGPLVGALIKAGSPAIASVITMALTPEIGPLAGLVGGGVGDILPRIATALGAPPDADPGQLAATVDADPSDAQTKLSAIEEEHSSALATLKQNQDFELASQGQQTAVNTVEAQNPSMFVAGWRPMLGWSLGAIVLASFVLPYPVWILATLGVHLPPPPVLDPQATYILAGLLGITIAARTVDKATGSAAPAIGGTSLTKTTQATHKR